MSKQKTQAQKVLDYISRHGSITAFEAFSQLHITCLAERIRDLRSRDIAIGSEAVRSGGSVFSRYFLM